MSKTILIALVCLATNVASAHVMPSLCEGKLGKNSVKFYISNNLSLLDRGTDVSDFSSLTINGVRIDNGTVKNYTATFKSAKMVRAPDSSNSCVVASGVALFQIALVSKSGVSVPLSIAMKCDDMAASCD